MGGELRPDGRRVQTKWAAGSMPGGDDRSHKEERGHSVRLRSDHGRCRAPLRPFSGTVIVYRSKRSDRVKILVWNTSGLVLIWKQLRQGAARLQPDRARYWPSAVLARSSTSTHCRLRWTIAIARMSS